MRGKWGACISIFMLLASCDGGSSDRVEVRDCEACHVAETAAWENFSSHRAIFTCRMCHEEIEPEPGPGHRAAFGCDQCHSEAGHPPEHVLDARDGIEDCLVCHTPHGSANIYLIRETLPIAHGDSAVIDFRNVTGRADYSYAELGEEEGGENGLEPGSGLCEICHVWTIYYNRDATGYDHFTSRCSRCHNHAAGFDTLSVSAVNPIPEIGL